MAVVFCSDEEVFVVMARWHSTGCQGVGWLVRVLRSGTIATANGFVGKLANICTHDLRHG